MEMKKKYYLYIFLFLLYLFFSWSVYKILSMDVSIPSLNICIWKLLDNILHDIMLCLEFYPR